MNYLSKQLPSHYSSMLLMVAIAISFTACIPKNVIVIRIPTDTANFSTLAKNLVALNHLTPKETIDGYKNNFAQFRSPLQLSNPNFLIPTGESFNKKDLLTILQQPDCIGIRIYYGAKSSTNTTTSRLVIVGVGKQGEDLYVDVDENKLRALDKPRPTTGTVRGPQATTVQNNTGSGAVKVALQHGQCIDPPCQN
jgi:hypothetical protein